MSDKSERMLEILAEYLYRRLARQLVPNIGDPPKRWLLAAPLCKWTGLQPDSFNRLTNTELISFLQLAIELKTGKPPDEPDEPQSPVILVGQGEQVIVNGEPKDTLTEAQYNVVQALLEAGSNGLSKDQLVQKSGHGDAVRVLKRLASDSDWASVIGLAGKPGGRYRITRATKRHK